MVPAMADQARETETAQGADVVEVVYRPTRRDIRVGIRVRERIRKISLLRGVVGGLFAALGLLVIVNSGLRSSVLEWLVVLFVWSIPHIQAHHVMRTIEWQGEFRGTVSDNGISVSTDYCTLTQRWPLFRGYRETRDYLVLLSRDPNILCVEFLPKRSLRSPEDAARLLALLDRHLKRI